MCPRDGIVVILAEEAITGLAKLCTADPTAADREGQALLQLFRAKAGTGPALPNVFLRTHACRITG